MGKEVDVLMAMSEKAAQEGDFILANLLMDQAEDLMVKIIWQGEAN